MILTERSPPRVGRRAFLFILLPVVLLRDERISIFSSDPPSQLFVDIPVVTVPVYPRLSGVIKHPPRLTWKISVGGKVSLVFQYSVQRIFFQAIAEPRLAASVITATVNIPPPTATRLSLAIPLRNRRPTIGRGFPNINVNVPSSGFRINYGRRAKFAKQGRGWARLGAPIATVCSLLSANYHFGAGYARQEHY